MKLRTFGLALAAAAVLVGCATTETGARRERLGVQAATMIVIERSGQSADKAARIVAAVADVRTMLMDDSATIGGIRSALLDRIAKENPGAGERILLIEFANTLADEVERRVGSGLLSPEAIVSVNAVLDWITDAASTYVPNPS